ncbi:hypothetical protein LR48_Vigan08g111000 [Vigna angularis]|uniref:Uncharacterized protein n=1 Tax=Phaseolus angularis TaxID=3914 RepID=A0A0L9V5M1_PHAAN|nr:hypothetical protein LR48_Vigan08g111000 [Vigna angularis]
MASSSSRRKWKVARIARNVNPIGWISEDIRRKLFSLRKIKTVVSHKYLKLTRVFYSNLKMSDETFCSTVKRVDIQVWIGHQRVYPISESWSANKTNLTKIEEDEWDKWYAVKIDCMSESLKGFLGLK